MLSNQTPFDIEKDTPFRQASRLFEELKKHAETGATKQFVACANSVMALKSMGNNEEGPGYYWAELTVFIIQNLPKEERANFFKEWLGKAVDLNIKLLQHIVEAARNDDDFVWCLAYCNMIAREIRIANNSPNEKTYREIFLKISNEMWDREPTIILYKLKLIIYGIISSKIRPNDPKFYSDLKRSIERYAKYNELSDVILLVKKAAFDPSKENQLELMAMLDEICDQNPTLRAQYDEESNTPAIEAGDSKAVDARPNSPSLSEVTVPSDATTVDDSQKLKSILKTSTLYAKQKADAKSALLAMEQNATVADGDGTQKRVWGQIRPSVSF